MKSKKIDISQKMLEKALLCCAKDDPALEGAAPCADCYLMQKKMVMDGHADTSETCFMCLASDAIDFIRKIKNFEQSLLTDMVQLKIENAQLRGVIEQMNPDFLTRKCRVCGCDWNHACNDHDFWVEEDLCSSCAAQGMHSETLRIPTK